MPNYNYRPELPSFGAEMRTFRERNNFSTREMSKYCNVDMNRFHSIELHSPLTERYTEDKNRIADFMFRYDMSPLSYPHSPRGGFHMRPHHRRKSKKTVTAHAVTPIGPVASSRIGMKYEKNGDMSVVRSIIKSNLDADVKVKVLSQLI